MDSAYLWTSIPFVIFFLVILRFEIKHDRSNKKRKEADEQVRQPVAKVTAKMHEQQFGTPPKEMEKAFPELRAAK